MKPTDLQVYDTFPTLIGTVVKGAQAMDQMPLNQMLTVLDRVQATGCYNTHGRTAPISAEEVARHRAVIEAARTFRDTAVVALTAAAAPVGGGG